jgi:hypothetical protein
MRVIVREFQIFTPRKLEACTFQNDVLQLILDGRQCEWKKSRNHFALCHEI